METISNMQLADLNSKPRGIKSHQNLIDHAIGIQFYPPPGSLHYQKIILGQFHDLTHINCEQKNKSEIKRRKYPVHTIVLQKPAQIISKKAVQFYYIYLYGREYSYDYKSPTYFCLNILYLYKHKYRISVHHTRCKNHQKIPPYVTLPCHNTLHIRIHTYVLVHKTPPIKPTVPQNSFLR